MKSPVLWIALAVMAVAGAVFTAGAVKDTRDRVLKIERETCRTQASCQVLLNRLLRFASDKQKRAVVESLPNIKERLKRQIAPPKPEAPVVPPRVRNPEPPAPQSPPPQPVPGPRGPQGPRGQPGAPAPIPTPPETPTVPEPPPLPKLPPLPQPVCDLLPALCPPDQP